jgi:hypothetical protein
MGIGGSTGAGLARWAEKDLILWTKNLARLGGDGTGGTVGVEADGDVMIGGRQTGGRLLGNAGGAGTRDGGGGAAAAAAETKDSEGAAAAVAAETKDRVAGVAGSILSGCGAILRHCFMGEEVLVENS